MRLIEGVNGNRVAASQTSKCRRGISRSQAGDIPALAAGVAIAAKVAAVKTGPIPSSWDLLARFVAWSVLYASFCIRNATTSLQISVVQAGKQLLCKRSQLRVGFDILRK